MLFHLICVKCIYLISISINVYNFYGIFFSLVYTLKLDMRFMELLFFLFVFSVLLFKYSRAHNANEFVKPY